MFRIAIVKLTAEEGRDLSDTLPRKSSREAYFDQQTEREETRVNRMWSFTQEEIASDFFEVESQRSAWHQEGYVRPLSPSSNMPLATMLPPAHAR